MLFFLRIHPFQRQSADLQATQVDSAAQALSQIHEGDLPQFDHGFSYADMVSPSPIFFMVYSDIIQ